MKIYSMDAFTCRQCRSTVMCRHLKLEENMPEEIACENCGAVYDIVIISGRRKGLQIKLREETSEATLLPETAFVMVPVTGLPSVVYCEAGKKIEECLRKQPLVSAIWRSLPQAPGLWKWRGLVLKLKIRYDQVNQRYVFDVETEGVWSRPEEEEVLLLMSDGKYEDEPVPIYGAPIAVAYGAPPVENQKHPTIKKWNKTHGNHPYRDILLVTRLQQVCDYDDEVVAAILGVLDQVCLHCWNAEKPCHCWNDE